MLVIVDVQVGVMQEAWDAPRVIHNVAQLVDRARTAGVPIVWVQQSDEELTPGSAPWQWVPELIPAPGERRLEKRFNSAFEQTALDEVLATLGATHIVLAGASTNWCIRATGYAALERGYDVTLVSDAHSTSDIPLDDGSRIAAADMVRELNVAMTWLEYPGRRTRTATARTIEFTAASV